MYVVNFNFKTLGIARLHTSTRLSPLPVLRGRFDMPRQYPEAPRLHRATSHDSEVSYEGDDRIISTGRRTKSSHDLSSSQRTNSNMARATNLRVFLGQGLGLRKPKSSQITTAPGHLGAGETETEADEPVSSVFFVYTMGLSTFSSQDTFPLPGFDLHLSLLCHRSPRYSLRHLGFCRSCPPL